MNTKISLLVLACLITLGGIARGDDDDFRRGRFGFGRGYVGRFPNRDWDDYWDEVEDRREEIRDRIEDRREEIRDRREDYFDRLEERQEDFERAQRRAFRRGYYGPGYDPYRGHGYGPAPLPPVVGAPAYGPIRDGYLLPPPPRGVGFSLSIGPFF